MHIEVKKLNGNEIGKCCLDEPAGYGLQKDDVVRFPHPLDTRQRYRIESKEFSFYSTKGWQPDLILYVTEL